MPAEFLTDEQAAAHAAYRGAPSPAELERFFFLDDADRELIESKRRAHHRRHSLPLATDNGARFTHGPENVAAGRDQRCRRQ
ncbi:DUF4158 domain-containing protein [Streptomyces stelliscabiei]|uniref:DUF4158 domain-containing protein n=1 Tax=Streptomyces stelliscabiei TaxID=146820 RepID=A0A8I0P071_9ACTN|nr:MULTISPECIES: DUF4158 domain-containing protein [Streptomyces]KND38775.1 hypothetical protein IQ64_38290 [Streptomyces stelliscabiei]MBE1593911.1 hypothetical protein [Streptomyces stelliscabiei]MDX2522279.1 DUF4158 domain-containing protein [Streptomyces stelliscabiei]MDX2557168.1 DUF4158 domain-containing protein [Streptomyces stelliscabiei]MDX2616441.1 DUF4158 domain-containing protein [Streptomyces stelliscabiei]